MILRKYKRYKMKKSDNKKSQQKIDVLTKGKSHNLDKKDKGLQRRGT